MGKVGSVFTSTGSQHGGQETTIFTFLPPLLHLGFVIVGLPYSFQGQMGVTEVMENSPYGARPSPEVTDVDNRRRLSSRVPGTKDGTLRK